MLGVDLHKETFYRTTQLEHREVKELTVKQLDGFVICSDGWRYKFAGKGAPLVNFILLKPDGGVLFIKVVDVSCKRKDAVAIKDQHLEVLEELSKELELQGIACWCMLWVHVAAWWKRLNLVVDLMEPIGNAIHRLEADMPYLHSSGKSKVNEAEAQLVQQVVRWLQRVVGLAHGCVGVVSPYAAQVLPTWKALVTHAETWEAKLPAGHPLALGVVAAFKRRAEMHYAPVHAAAYVVDPAHFKPPRAGVHARPPFMDLTPKQLEDTMTRLSKASTAAVRKELTNLKLGIQEQTRTSEDGKTVAADISVRRGLWDFTAREDYPLFSEAATRLLSMHITTAAAERNWSAWGDTNEAGRAQLGIKKAEMMVYIHANIPKGASTMPSELVALGITA
ncbi:hypothetical protein QJQ45_003482 [Haematococcus lacustris]|nr:hypothetical protein QJQ45_003482 [Haematococcus lacustris]